MLNVILLVDDDEVVLNALSRVLHDSSYVILKTRSAKEALKILKEREVHVLISDHRMPEMTGSELLKEVKENYPNIVTLILSAHADFEMIQNAINEGHIYKFLSKPWDNDFLRKQVRECVLHYNTQKSIQRELEQTRFFDKLTDLWNREALIRQINDFEKAVQKNNQTIALLLIDIDRFGEVNNRVGHYVGDEILKAVADRLRAWIPADAFLARIGNDEFAILFDAGCQEGQVESIVRKLNQILRQPFIISEHEIYMTFSIGIALYPHDLNRASGLIEKSNIALNYCKKTGGGIQFYDAEMEKSENSNIIIEAEIHKALEKNEFINFYQPIVSLKTGKVCGVEALVRWQHPKRGLLAPIHFIPLCEKSELIVAIDDVVLEKGLEDLKFFNSMSKINSLYISSNFSTRHFMSADLKETISKVIKNSSLPPSNIVIEVTESLLVHDSHVLQGVLKSLRDLGVRLALDDFGTGFASLSYIRKYPFDLLKIDRSYVREIGRSKNDEALITAMVNMAKSLGLSVVAEGIESQNQIDFLKDKECEFGQGFIFSRPISKEEFIQFIERKILG